METMHARASKERRHSGSTSPLYSRPDHSRYFSQLLYQHYQSFCLFQHHAMVMSQLIQKMTPRAPSPDSTSLGSPPTIPPHMLSPTEDPRFLVPPTFPELDEYSPLFPRYQSDQGYSSSMTSDSRSKSSRLSFGSDSTEKSRSSVRASPEVPRSRSSVLLDENTRCSFDDDNSVQTPEVSSSVNTKNVQPHFDAIKIKIEPPDDFSDHDMSSQELMEENTSDIACDAPKDTDSPETLLNSEKDVMWAVKEEEITPEKFMPSPDKSSCDNSKDQSYFQSYLGNLHLPREMQPLVESKSERQFKKCAKKWLPYSENVQVDAVDFSMPKKRKLPTPSKERKKKRQKNCVDPSGSPVIKIVKVESLQPEITKRVLHASEKSNIMVNESVHIPLVEAKNAIKSKSSIKTVPLEENTAKSKTSIRKPTDTSKKFVCNLCDKTYSQRSSLHTHMRIHTGVRPYACKDCSRTFTDCSTYIKHCRLHTGEKPYACAVCGRCFTQSGNMMRHQLKCKARTLYN